MVFSREAGPLKIATFNINNINKRLHNLTAWLARAQPDVVCLQELKVEQRAFPTSALRDLGYRGVWLGERSWTGVAILARECDPVLTRSKSVVFRQGDAAGSFPSLSNSVRSTRERGVDRWVRGEENASDHAPAWIVLDR